MTLSDKNLDVLQNLEFAMVEVWRAHPEMTDHVASRAYEALFQRYRAELRNHEPKPHGLTGLDAEAFKAVDVMCRFRLGRGPAPGKGGALPAPITVEELVDCLRELSRSVRRHTERAGRQGYLTFIDGFLP